MSDAYEKFIRGVHAALLLIAVIALLLLCLFLWHLDLNAKQLNKDLVAAQGTIVALHHPPIPSPIEPMARIALRDPSLLLDAIAGTDVRIVLCGHTHHEAFGMLGTTPVWVSPATAYRLDITSTGAFRGVPGAAFSRVDLTDGGPRVTVIPVPMD